MKIHRFNIDSMRTFEAAAQEQLIFIQPVMARLTRLYHIPEKFKSEELIQVLNTVCTHFHNGVYYFRLRDEAERDTIMDTLALMDLIPFSIVYHAENLN